MRAIMRTAAESVPTAMLAHTLRLVRETLNLSQHGWALQCRVSPRTVQRWETGERVPTELELLGLREVLRRPELRERIHAREQVETLLVSVGLVERALREQGVGIPAVAPTAAAPAAAPVAATAATLAATVAATASAGAALATAAAPTAWDVDPPLRRQGSARCQRDGLPFAEHAACRGCELLAGPAHHVPALDADGHCPDCARRVAREAR